MCSDHISVKQEVLKLARPGIMDVWQMQVICTVNYFRSIYKMTERDMHNRTEFLLESDSSSSGSESSETEDSSESSEASDNDDSVSTDGEIRLGTLAETEKD